MIRVDIDVYGRAYGIVSILPYDSKIPQRLKFKIDTGADSSTISRKTLEDVLRFPSSWAMTNRVEMGTSSMASQVKEVSYVVQLPLIRVYGYTLHNWPFRVLFDKIQEPIKKECGKCTHVNEPIKDDCKMCPYTGVVTQDYRLLLGNDLLAGFDLFFNRKAGCVELTRHNQFKPIWSFLPGQEIMDSEVGMSDAISRLNKF